MRLDFLEIISYFAWSDNAQNTSFNSASGFEECWVDTKGFGKQRTHNMHGTMQPLTTVTHTPVVPLPLSLAAVCTLTKDQQQLKEDRRLCRSASWELALHTRLPTTPRLTQPPSSTQEHCVKEHCVTRVPDAMWAIILGFAGKTHIHLCQLVIKRLYEVIDTEPIFFTVTRFVSNHAVQQPDAPLNNQRYYARSRGAGLHGNYCVRWQCSLAFPCHSRNMENESTAENGRTEVLRENE